MIDTKNKPEDQVYKILIVDDEKEVLNALQMTLEFAQQFKSEIVCINNPSQAIKVLEKDEFDLVLTDYKMGKVNGVDLLKEVKDKYPETIRILITGFSDIKIAKDAINKADVHHYIEKPWDNKQLRSIVYQALKSKYELQSKNISKTKHKIIDWLMAIYNDAENMGLELNEVDYYIEIAMSALDSNDLQKALTNINRSVNIMMELAENSYPELSIKKLDNVQLQSGKWNKLDLKITNKGNIHAIDVKISYKGELEIKGIDNIPKIEINETKILAIKILPNKIGIFPLEINLTCKKMFDETEFQTDESLWVQVGDITGKTKLKRKFGYHKGYIKMELNIINEDLREIKDVNLELIYDDNILILSHIKPNLNKFKQKFIIGDISSRDGKNIIIYFDPLLCTDTFIGGGVSFKDWEDNEKYIMLTPQKIRILCPKLNVGDRLGLAELKELLKNELTYSGNKIINIPLGLGIKEAFNTCKKMIFKYNTKLVHEIIEPNPYIAEAWFYCLTDDSKYKFVIKIAIEQNMNCIELYIASSNNPALTGLLTDVLNGLNMELQSQGIILQPIRQIDNLILKESLLATKRCLLYDEFDNLDKIFEIDFAQKIIDESKSMTEKFERIARNETLYLGKRRAESFKMD